MKTKPAKLYFATRIDKERPPTDDQLIDCRVASEPFLHLALAEGMDLGSGFACLM